MTLLSFKEKHVVQSDTDVTTTSTTLVDDTQAEHTITLAATQTVLAIYVAYSDDGDANAAQGGKYAIDVDGTPYCTLLAGSQAGNNARRSACFWVGSLGAGSHTFTGQFCSLAGVDSTIGHRTLLIYVFDGDEFDFHTSTDHQSVTGTTLSDDLAAMQITFTPSGACKALFLYGLSSTASDTCPSYGRQTAINVGGTAYGQLNGCPYSSDYSCGETTVYAAELAASSTTLKGQFCSSNTNACDATLHHIAYLLFESDTLIDWSTSTTEVEITDPDSLADDTQLQISRTTSDERELLAIVASGEIGGNDTGGDGYRYGVYITANDRAQSREGTGGGYPGSVFVAYGETLAAGAQTVEGRISNNNTASTQAVHLNRHYGAAVWLKPSGGTTPVVIPSRRTLLGVGA